MPRNPAPWYRTSTGWWMAQVNRQQVKLLQASNTEGNRRKAAAVLADLLKMEAMAGSEESGDNLTVAKVIDLYLDHAKTHLAERTFYERLHILQEFAEACGHQTIRKSIPYHLTKFLDNPRWKSDWTQSTVVAAVQRPFNWAADQRLIKANPFKGVRRSAGEPRRPMTDDEFARLVEAASDGRTSKNGPSPGERFIELLRFLRATGARTIEAATLEWSQLDLNAGVIVMKKHKTSSQQRKPKPRIIMLVPEVVDLLTRIRERNEPGPHVFLNYRGSLWNRSNLSLRMRRARKQAGLPDDAKLYGLRHRFGTQAIMNGVDLKTLSTLMGHTSTRTTEHYLHIAGQVDYLRDAMLRAVGSDSAPELTHPASAGNSITGAT